MFKLLYSQSVFVIFDGKNIWRKSVQVYFLLLISDSTTIKMVGEGGENGLHY